MQIVVRLKEYFSRRCYFYNQAALKTYDKYVTIRTMLTDIFYSNYQCYGYHRLHAILKHEGLRLSEKVVRRLIVEDSLSSDAEIILERLI